MKHTEQQIEEAKKVLIESGYFLPTLWSTEDVISKAEEMDITLTPEQLQSVCELIDNTHDANFGVNWEWIEACIERVIEQEQVN